MKLKRLKLFGFKTFAEPTTIEFDAGITAIVGPNGSGKSNIVDATRWVLGETSTRSLRSAKLEDVIFAGNEKRKPLGLAEVSISFDNSDHALPIEYEEVEITRRAYRAGESEYFINRTQVRLRDVHDLLMGTGLGPGSYAIVSQGEIDAVLKSKPTERRVLFEETAGISKFLARKNESLRRLEQTEQNAIRISDLIAETERRIPELETQVRRARRYRRVNARVRDLEILSYLRASASRREERERLREEMKGDEERRATAAARVATLGANLAETRTQLYRQELHLEELRSQGQRRRGELAQAETEYAAALARREALEESLATASQQLVERRGHLTSVEREAQVARGALDTAERGALEAREALLHAEHRHREQAETMAAAQSRLNTIEELENALEGHVPGTRAVVEAWQRGELGGIEGIVSNLITIEERYAHAMDVAFGARLSHIVTRTTADAQQAIAFLNRTEQGRATFMPLDRIQQRPGTARSTLSHETGVVGYAPQLIHAPPQYAPLIEYLVGEVLVVEDTRTAMRLFERGAARTIVTLGGEMVTDGALTGGRFQRERSILSRRAHAAQLRDQLAEMRSALAALDGQAQEARKRAESAERAREQARETAARHELTLAEARAETALRSSEIERLQREVAAAGGDAPLPETRASHKHIEGLRRGVSETDAQIDKAREERESLLQRQSSLEGDVHTAEIEERDVGAAGESRRTRMTQIEAELGMIVSQFAQNPASEEECRDVEERYRKEPDSVVEDLPRLRDELTRLTANVNLNAEAEREELAERERFLRTQLDDLTQARETLLESIKEIELQTQSQFNETFERVVREFAQVYARLFEGGTAHMWQTNPENLAETGIEIAVQPPGKKQMPLPALSGGEQAMTAAALIFALIRVRPAPFYLLDEVDAAMDDANVARFSEMVRELSSGDAEMIIVTHNKKTMELANQMYGVTMRESGVTSIISAELTPEREPAFT